MYPKKTKYLALFSYNPKSQRFDTTVSLPEQINDHFSMEDAKEFLAEPECELAQHYKAFPPGLHKFLQNQSVMIFLALMKLAIGLIGVSLLVLSKTIKDKQTFTTVSNILIILMLICCFIMVTVVTISYFWTQAKKKHAFKVMEKIQAHIQETHSYYQGKGVAWSIPQDFISSSVMHANRDNEDEPKGHKIELWRYYQPNRHYDVQQQNSQGSTRLIEEFLFNKDALKFINIYSPLRTDDQITFEEVKQFLDLATPSFDQREKAITSLVSAGKWGFIGFALMTIIFSFVLLEKVDGLSLATYSFVYIIIVILIVFCYAKNWRKKDREIIPNIQAVIEQTAYQFKAKGFRWVLPERYYKSVQLWEDKSPQIEYGQLPRRSSSSGREDVKQEDIVFFYDNKFLSHHYFSGLTRNKVSKAEIKTFLTEIESRFALYRQTCFGRFYRVFIFFAYLVGCVTSAVLLSMAYYPVFAIAFMPAGLVVLGLVYTSLSRAHYSRLKKQMFEVIFQRAPEYDQKGLKWFIFKDGPLTIVLRDKNAVGEPVIPRP